MATNIREFTKPRRRRRGQRGVKNEFIFYLRISRYSKVIYFVYHCQNYHETQCKHSDKYEIKILKFSRRGSRSPDNAEFGHFTLLIFRGRQRNVQ